MKHYREFGAQENIISLILRIILNKNVVVMSHNKMIIFNMEIRMKQVPDGYKKVSFDVKSLFTNVPLEKTIEITLKKIYKRQEINTSISKKEMKQLLTLCTKNVHFTYDNKVYQQNDGVAMGSPLGPVLSGIFMVKLENSLVPTLNESMTLCQRFVDDNITFVKNDSIAYVLDQLNSFHEQIQFTYEVEIITNCPFLMSYSSKTPIR